MDRSFLKWEALYVEQIGLGNGPTRTLLPINLNLSLSWAFSQRKQVISSWRPKTSYWTCISSASHKELIFKRTGWHLVTLIRLVLLEHPLSAVPLARRQRSKLPHQFRKPFGWYQLFTTYCSIRIIPAIPVARDHMLHPLRGIPKTGVRALLTWNHMILEQEKLLISWLS